MTSIEPLQAMLLSIQSAEKRVKSELTGEEREAVLASVNKARGDVKRAVAFKLTNGRAPFQP
ncbi:hypothetical protein B0H94_101275 [Salsuginibacillus halophilus]|uniref:Uncharacterized protein n=1 Tax=Salsuginibacillus halophilus TaxID=517424 RepID=A0A2P8HYR6_9BACI|nr:hypothetical protein [Salsuginibacillus halophilus]PSL51360.1 hypothetical protein B0H94_101275 [Salsuginibacillus halophilus]